MHPLRPWDRLTYGIGRLPRRLTAIALLIALAAAAAPAAALRMKPDRIQERYRVVLRQLAGGDEAGALERLYDLETTALEEHPGTAQLDRYWRIKLAVVRELLEVGRLEQLMPIAVLHHDAFAMYREREQPVLAAHSRQMATELAELLADRAEDPVHSRFAGEMLASFAARLQESRAVSASAEFFRRAIERAPGIGFAHLGLAAAHEKYGEYDLAIEVLERLLRHDPLHHHARLRLAICLARLNRLEAAESGLAALLGAEAPEWIRSLAFQELARLYQVREEPDRAEATLRRGLEELGDDPQLLLMLAALLDGRRQPRAAARVLERLAAHESSEPSPRLRYDKWPTDGLPEVRASLQGLMVSRLPMLAATLGTEAPKIEVSP